MNNLNKSKYNNKVKPKYYRLLGQVINLHFDSILNYLEVKEISNLRATNQMFLALTHEYYPKRLRLEIERIRFFQDENYDSLLSFMNIIDSQIPFSKNNWLEFDLPSVVDKLKILDKKILTELKSIKNLGKVPETVFAPFCLILGYNKNNIKVKNDGWLKTFQKIISETDFKKKMTGLDLDNLNEADMLDAFVYLNMDQLNVQSLSKVVGTLGQLIMWCQAVVSYHILIHPFTCRNIKGKILIQSFKKTTNFKIS